ncbi:MAG: Rieske (2Fe-2S) protein [Candidatus Cloacimonetes bacterium]|nr:Rieske (2Fe-2S) protein [Candidatus Cloacimonadota bacterium]
MQKILAGTLQDLEIKGRLIVKSGKRQILVLRSSKGIHAVDHRCPHEGYPLSQGVQNDCVLTCAYHNWKFDLQTGQNSVGGDGLKIWPVELRDQQIFVSVAEPNPLEVQKEAVGQVEEALDQRNAGLLMRGLARYSNSVPTDRG